MTLIIAIQTEDSIIVSADKRIITTQNKNHANQCKLHLWQKGIVTGSGEFQVIKRVNQWLQQYQNLSQLPQILDNIKKRRITEAGQHKQITHSSIVVSITEKDTPKLYSIGLNNQLEQLKPKDIIILYPTDHQFCSESIGKVQNLYTQIKEYSQFTNNQSWMNHYLNLLSSLYKKQSLSCEKISADFHVFLQSPSYSTIVHMIND